MKDLRVDLGLAEPGAPTNVACNRYYSFIFVGSTQQGEAIAIIIQFVNDQWEIVQRLVRIDIVAKLVTATQISQVLMETLFTDMQIQGQQVLAVMRDGASVNGAAIRNLQVFMTHGQLMDIICFAHTLDNVGLHFNTPVLDDFGQSLVRLFSSSWMTQLRWKERTGQGVKSVSNTALGLCGSYSTSASCHSAMLRHSLTTTKILRLR